MTVGRPWAAGKIVLDIAGLGDVTVVIGIGAPAGSDVAETVPRNLDGPSMILPDSPGDMSAAGLVGGAGMDRGSVDP